MRAFYVFPCQHIFHRDCLARDLLPQLTTAQRTRYQPLVVRAPRSNADHPICSRAMMQTAIMRGERVRFENEVAVLESSRAVQINPSAADELLGNECILCGDVMVRSIRRPFITDAEAVEVARQWS